MSLLSRVRPRDEAASVAFERDLAAFVTAHYPRLVRLAGLVCRDRSEAEDAVQAALEQAWRRGDSLRDPGSLKPWLDRIVVREAIRVGRRNRGLLGRVFGEPREIEVEQAGAHDPTAAHAARRAALRLAFEALPPAQRAVVTLHLYAGYSIAETAELVGVPLETARSRLRLARARLREQLGEDPR